MRVVQRDGLTMIELVVVVALVGIIAGVVAPSFGSLDPRPAGQRARDRVDFLIRSGQTVAIEHATVVNITIDPATKRFWLGPSDTTALLGLPSDAVLMSRGRRVHVRIEPDGETTFDQALLVRDTHGTVPVNAER